jgi:hypothetical protein
LLPYSEGNNNPSRNRKKRGIPAMKKPLHYYPEDRKAKGIFRLECSKSFLIKARNLYLNSTKAQKRKIRKDYLLALGELRIILDRTIEIIKINPNIDQKITLVQIKKALKGG